MRFDDLDEPVQRTARWIAERYVASGAWPTEAEFARFCFRAEIPLDRLRSGHWHDVYEGSIGFTNATDNPSVRVKPWIFYDLDLCAEAFKAAFEAYLSAVDQLAAGALYKYPFEQRYARRTLLRSLKFSQAHSSPRW
jgi:hypothetical protein